MFGNINSLQLYLKKETDLESFNCARSVKKNQGGELASDGVGMISSKKWGELQLFSSDGGRNAGCPALPRPSHPISERPALRRQVFFEAYSVCPNL